MGNSCRRQKLSRPWCGEMLNNFLVFAALSGVGWLLGICTMPTPAHSADTAPAVNSNTSDSASPVETRRAPVPVVRRVTVSPRAPIPTVEPAPRPPNAAVEPTPEGGAAELPARDELTGTAANAAVEADGYKRTTVLGRGPNGTWRVKGFRGDTEVVLTVDGAGTVTME